MANLGKLTLMFGSGNYLIQYHWWDLLKMQVPRLHLQIFGFSRLCKGLRNLQFNHSAGDVHVP